MKKGLGKGLDALFTNNEKNEGSVLEIKTSEIEPNIGQPRKNFDDEKIQELANSIKEHGIIQPIVVSKEENFYKIIAGERRWRAAKVAGLATVPVIIKSVDPKKVVELALIENIQRQDLNAIEEAEAIKVLINEYNLTQEEIAKTLGKSRSKVANTLRLLNLDIKLRELVLKEKISEGHARALLSIEDKEIQLKLAQEIIEKGLNVRDIEKYVQKINTSKKIKKSHKNIFFNDIEENLKNFFGTKVKITSSNKDKGKIVIEYMSNNDLDRIIGLINK